MAVGLLHITVIGETPEKVLAELKARFEEHGFPEPKEIIMRGPHYGHPKWSGTAKGEL